MIVPMPLAIPVTRLSGLGDIEADFNAAYAQADRVYLAAGRVLQQPFVGGALKAKAKQVYDRAAALSTDIETAARTPDELRRVTREAADLAVRFRDEIQPQVRRNGILVALGLTAVAAGGAYLIWKKG